MKNPFYSIGHAVRSADDFAAALKSQGVTLLADVRSVPRSLKNPQFNEAVLPEFLRREGIGYLRIPELGGFRGRSKTVRPEVNAYWQHNSFHSYADYAMGEQFQKGLQILMDAGGVQRTAFMCAEMLWWRCHRRIITDYLLASGQTVYHIFTDTHVEKARLNEHAKLSDEGVLTYGLST